MKHYLKLVQNMSGSGLVAIEPENRNILTLSISKERNKHAHCREVYFRSSEGSWKTSSFHRWRYMVSTGMSVPELKTSYSFII